MIKDIIYVHYLNEFNIKLINNPFYISIISTKVKLLL